MVAITVGWLAFAGTFETCLCIRGYRDARFGERLGAGAPAPGWSRHERQIQAQRIESNTNIMNQLTTPADGDESFADLFEQTTDERPEVKEGTIVTGTIVDVIGDYAVVDVGLKAEGQVPLREFKDEDDEDDTPPVVNIGDSVEVLLETAEDQHGLVILSKEKARIASRFGTRFRQPCERDEPHRGNHHGQRVKGGLSASCIQRWRQSVPSRLAGRSSTGPQPRCIFIGQNFQFKIIKFNKKRGNIVLSRRVLLEAERAEPQERHAQQTPGGPSCRRGRQEPHRLRRVHRSGRHRRPAAYHRHVLGPDQSSLRAVPGRRQGSGQSPQVQQRDSERVSLGLKQITADPWINAEEKYIPGTVVQGKVVSLKDYGAFIELEEGIEGLVHVSEMSWTRQVKNPKQMLATSATR